MTSDGAMAGGLFASLRRLLSTLLEIGQVRLALLANEFEREKLRLFDGLLQAALALLCLGLGLLLLAALLVLLTPEPWRPLTLALLCLACLGGGLALAARARRTLAAPPGGALAATLAELERDRAGLGGER